MHVLHGTWLLETQAFALWGEDTAREPVYRRGRRGTEAPHPFVLSVSDWLRYLDRFAPDADPDDLSLTLWLPGAGKKVQPSPEAEAAGASPLEERALTFLAWRVEAITLGVSDLLGLMLALPSSPRGFALGKDLAFWQQAALVVMGSLVEGRYVPTLQQRGSQFVAGWELRPDPEVRAQLIAHMPPLCRAATARLADAPPPDVLLDSFFCAAVDTFIRQRYSDGSRLPAHPWLRALLGPTPVVGGTTVENRKLYKAWEAWQAADRAAPGAFRVCFRLDEPAEDADSWPLAYLLQATDDPSLLVEAETVWVSRADRLDYLKRRFDRPQEKLLAALGLASRVFAPVERSLRSRRPTDVILTREEAYRFLVEAAPLLEASGFAVLVPNWWRKRARLKARAHLRAEAAEPTGFLTRDTLLRYKWELSLGGAPISREEFEQLAALKQPLVRYRGEWVTLDPEQVEAALRFFEEAGDAESELGLLDALKLTADGAEACGGIMVDSVAVEGWLDDLLKRLREPDSAAVPDIPQGLRARLRPYQERGFGWLVQMRRLGLGACLADDMGLGKTLQTITLWLHERERLGVSRPALLVCPTSVVGNWRYELGRFAPALRVLKHQGADRLRDEAFAEEAGKVDVVLTSYALLHRDLDTLKRVDWSTVVLDEAQNIKNPSTKQAQAARALNADLRLALTGTPVENRLGDLWSILHFLNPGYLGSQSAFRSGFATPIERYGDQEAAAALKRLTAPFILRRAKTDPKVIADLPEKFENKVHCTLTPEQATLYEAVVREEMELVESADDDLSRRGAVLRMLTRLKQICNHPAQFLKEGDGATLVNRSGKLTRLAEMLEEVRDVDERALVFTQYAEMGALLQDYLREHLRDMVLFLHGGTPARQREEMVRHFQSPHGPPVFILSLKAGGTGLNLTAANHVFHFDRWYNPAVENQATDRAFRIGQTKNVQVHKFLCLGTLEERIDQLIEHKQALAEQIVGAGESWLSALSNAELRGLVTLRREVMEMTEA